MHDLLLLLVLPLALIIQAPAIAYSTGVSIDHAWTTVRVTD